MTRAPRRMLAAAASLSLIAGAAVAQPAFEPPLDTPTPLTQPVYIELLPGSVSECEMAMSVENMDMPPPPPFRTTMRVEEAEGGVRVIASDDMSNTTTTFFLGDDGTIAIDDAGLGGLQLSEEAQEEVRDSMQNLMLEGMLHRRTLAQGETVFEADELSRLFGAMLEAMPPGFELGIDGGSVVAGETTADGRQTLVFNTGLDMTMTFDNAGETIVMNMTADGSDAVDVETGLYRYARYRIVVSLPPDPSLPVTEVVANMQIDCNLTSGAQ